MDILKYVQVTCRVEFFVNLDSPLFINKKGLWLHMHNDITP